jgi:transcriptional regulator with XRE-family HTH domain
MPYQTTFHLIQKHGQDKTLWIKTALNEGVPQSEIARRFGLSKARMSQICSKIMRPNWDFCQEAQDAFRFEISVKRRDIQALRHAAGSTTELHLIKGPE